MTVEYRLYLELLFVGGVLLAILFANNIFLYKQKITDFISLMTISGIVMCALEIIWTVVDRNPRLRALTYISSCGYCIAFTLFSIFLNRYLINRFGIQLKKKGILVGYVLPFVAFTLLCISTPWTRLVFWVDESGTIQERILFETLFQFLLYFYVFSPLLVAIFFLTLGKSRKPENGEIPVSIFVFGVMAPVLYWLEQLVLGEDLAVFENLSLPVSLALVYLVTNVSTHTVLETRAHVEAVETDLRIAAKIQTDALPPVAPEFAKHLELNLRCSMNTAKEVGGDFYDYFPIDENRICFLIADVSGKGTPAALFMMTAKTIIKDYALTRSSTAEIFTAVNARLCEGNDAGMFATAWIGILDTDTMTLQYTNAGHNYPILQRRGKPCELLQTVHGLFLAGMDFTEYSQDEIQLEAGDRLLLYTDGVTEAHDRTNELYGTERLEKILETAKDLSGEQVLNSIIDDINVFARGVPQFDDITMVILSIKE